MNGIREILHLSHLRREEQVEEYEEMMDLQLVRQPKVYDRRADHMIVLDHAEFKRTFRFTQDGVKALVTLLHDQLHYDTNRGRPLSVLQQVLVALNHYAGGHFQRTTALCGGISQPTVCRVSERVSWAICQHKGKFLKMPTEAQMQATAARMMEKYQLPRFAYGVDGMMVRFDTAPRDFPATIGLQDFNCRKNFWAINCQVVCNDEFLILDLDCDWPGRTHDARIWAWSDVRKYLEGGVAPVVYYLAGDSAYPISPVLMKPYNNREAADDALSRLFNSRLSAIRTRMSENVFARWKGMFPILRMLRAHYHHAKIIIVATAILHNIAIKFGEVEPEEDEEVLGLLRAVVTQMDEPVVEADRYTAFFISFQKYFSYPMKMVFSPHYIRTFISVPLGLFFGYIHNFSCILPFIF
jgi:hypothetical protein